MNNDEPKKRIYDKYLSVKLTGDNNDVCKAFFSESFPNFKKKYHAFLPKSNEAKIIELGCGDGLFMLWLNTLGFNNVYGCDISDEQLNIARAAGVDSAVKCDIFEFLCQYEDKADLIVLRDVLEHFSKSEIYKILDLCRSKLCNGGGLLLHVPNAESPFFGRIRYGDFTHEQAFTMNSLNQILKTTGYDCVKFKSDEGSVSGLRNIPRYICWKFAQTIYKFLLCAEVGFGKKIVTQNIIAFANSK
jgi:2-polyprenyl-3-methyl-5-hydroxy-6-metoxy-1,4-benzoquinol methylase